MKKALKDIPASIRARLQNVAKETGRPFSEVLQYYIIYSKPRLIDYPVILDLPKPRLQGYPTEGVVSKKFEAIVKLGSLNSRMKDFYDLWLMQSRFDFDGLKLAEALKMTFRHRKAKLPEHQPIFAEEIYDERSDRQTLWKAFLNKGEIKHAPEQLSQVAGEIEKFLVAPLEATRKGEKISKRWKAPGPWKTIR